MKAYVSYIDRLEESGNVKTYEGESLLHILKEVHKTRLYEIDEEGAIEDGVDIDENMLIESIDYVNGDGCDYIISIINDQGEMIYPQRK